MLGMSWAYQKPWEDFFTVVNWDQRGVGKNFAAAGTARLGPTMTDQQHVRDAEVVVRHVLERLGQRKLVNVGTRHRPGRMVDSPHTVGHPRWCRCGGRSGHRASRSAPNRRPLAQEQVMAA